MIEYRKSAHLSTSELALAALTAAAVLLALALALAGAAGVASLLAGLDWVDLAASELCRLSVEFEGRWKVRLRTAGADTLVRLAVLAETVVLCGDVSRAPWKRMSEDEPVGL